MVLKEEIIEAFRVFDLDPSADQSIASTAYKKLALKHHPDRNFGDESAKERFQEIGAAWNICLRHYSNPASSHIHEPGAHRFNFADGAGRKFKKDDDVPLDDEERDLFFDFLFKAMFMNRGFSFADGQRYRRQRAGRDGGVVHSFSGGFAQSQQRQQEHAIRQQAQNEVYLERVREFEKEQAEEQARLDHIARSEKKDQACLASARNHAFQLGKEGRGVEMIAQIAKFDLDVTKPRKVTQSKKDAKVTPVTNFETLLHIAAGVCSADDIEWLVNRGADTAALNGNYFTPYQVAISGGNVPVVQYFLGLFWNTKSTDPRYQSFRDGCHPSKAAKNKESITPLQLAIKSNNVEMVVLLLKDATVHDVEKCWRILDEDERSSAIGDVLLSKNGFVPAGHNDIAQQQAMSAKALRKAKQAEEEKKAYEDKMKRLAEEDENRLKKQARRNQAAKEEEGRQLKRQEEERRREEEGVLERMRFEAAQQVKARKEDEERARKQRLHVEVEARETRQREEELRAAKIKLKEQEAEAKETRRREEELRAVKIKLKEQEAEAKETRRREEELRAAKIKLKEQEAEAKETRRREEELRAARIKLKEQEAASRQKIKEAAARKKQQTDAQQQRDKMNAARLAQQKIEFARAQVTREKQIAIQREEIQRQKEVEQRQAEVENRARQQERLRLEEEERVRRKKDAEEVKLAAARQRRAEQSARDKARAQRLRDKKMKTQVNDTTPTLISVNGSTLVQTPSNTTRTGSCIHSTPPPVPLHTRPHPTNCTTAEPIPTLMSPPMTPEDLQTMSIPEDLFAYELPAGHTLQSLITPSATSTTASHNVPAGSSKRGTRGRGRGPSTDRMPIQQDVTRDNLGPKPVGKKKIPCRFFNSDSGCGKGDNCPFVHTTAGRVTQSVLEMELAMKNKELEHMRAELAAARAATS